VPGLLAGRSHTVSIGRPQLHVHHSSRLLARGQPGRAPADIDRQPTDTVYHTGGRGQAASQSTRLDVSSGVVTARHGARSIRRPPSLR